MHGISKTPHSHHCVIAMQSSSSPLGHGTIVLCGYVPAIAVVLPDFSGESLRHIPVAILNYVGSFTMASCALMAVSKMVHSWYYCRFDSVIGADVRVLE